MHAIFRDMTEAERAEALAVFLRSVPFVCDGVASDTFREIGREVLGFTPTGASAPREICPLGAACFARWKLRGAGGHEFETLPLYPTERAAADILLPDAPPEERDKLARALIWDYLAGDLRAPEALTEAFGVPLPEGATWVAGGEG